MNIKKINLKNEKILIIGPIYNKLEKLFQIERFIDKSTILVFLGDISYPYKSTSEIPNRINSLIGFLEGKKYYYISGDKDLEFIKNNYSNHTDICEWLQFQCLSIGFTYPSNSLLVIHGGILPKHKTIEDLNDDLNNSVSITNWHKKYDGRFGYVISSHPSNKENLVKNYEYSMSLDTSCHETNVLAIQEFNENGLGNTYYI